MKFTRRLLLLPALALALAGGAEAVPASAKPAPDVQLQLTYNSGSGISGMAGGTAQIKNGVSYMPANLVTIMGLKVKWNNADKTATFSGWNKSFSMKLGQSTGVLDGKKTSLGGTPYMADKQLYVPVKFVVAALEGGPVRWDAATNTIRANGLHMYRGYSEVFDGGVYSLSLDSGELYLTTKQNTRHKLAVLGRGLDVVDFTFERTPAGLTLLQVVNSYGEPHVHAEYYTYLVKNNSVIRQGHTNIHTSFGTAPVWAEGKLVFNDGRTLRLIEDGTGAVSETVDIPKLLGTTVAQDVYYNVEAVYPDALLVRPTDTAFLTLVDRATGKQTVLYKQLLNAERQREVEQPDFMFPGDYIYFTGRTDNVFTFKLHRMDGSQDIIKTYTWPGSQN
ncbi:copper amine oxidase N-terminal domain-containing protein [Paenibacillus sp. FSL R7-0333]|uniref:copper amine oxidase N-terminal domain-containing protein n=1 Tax=Paenibacillus sp. FSL R7-0333 TaxID=1926587 RepID=UPI0026D8DA42